MIALIDIFRWNKFSSMASKLIIIFWIRTSFTAILKNHELCYLYHRITGNLPRIKKKILKLIYQSWSPAPRALQLFFIFFYFSIRGNLYIIRYMLFNLLFRKRVGYPHEFLLTSGPIRAIKILGQGFIYF